MRRPALTATEFPATIDRASYVVPTIGIGAIGGCLGGAVAMIAGLWLGARGWAGDDVSLAAWLSLSVVLSMTWWLRRRYRIHHERKLVLDERGLTYVAFAGRERFMRWTDIIEITEDEEWELGRWLTLRHPSGRFVIESHAFHGYGEIRELTRRYLPGRTRLIAY